MATIQEFIGTDLAHRRDFLVTPSGDLDKISGLENLKLRLLHRLVTSPGAFIHLPNYGVGIKDFQNAPNTIGNQIKMTKRIDEQFILDEAVENVKGVTFIKKDDRPQTVQIIVRVRVRGFSDVEFTFTPFGGTVQNNAGGNV